VTKTDGETGLPIITPEKTKSVQIDNPKLIADLRPLEEARMMSENAARTIGFQLVLMMGTVAAVGQKAYMDDRAWQEELAKIGALYGLKREQISGTDLDKGLILLK